MLNFDFEFDFFTDGEILLKTHFNLVWADIKMNHDLHPVPSGKLSDRPGFLFISLTKLIFRPPKICNKRFI